MADSDPPPDPRPDPILITCAGAFFLLSIASLLVLVVIILRRMDLETRPQNVLFGIGTLAAFIGFLLVRMARRGRPKAPKVVLPEEGEKYLGPALERSPDPIGDWTRLAGLAGGTGVFRKLEFSGMPLATILMTVLFCLLGIGTPLMSKIAEGPFEDLSKGFLELAKLTLGAFIGSFVTKSTTRETEATRAGAVAAAREVASRTGSPSPPSSAASPGP